MTLLDFPAVDELAQCSQTCGVDLGPLGHGQTYRPLDKGFFSGYRRATNGGFFVVHAAIIRDSKRLANVLFLNHNKCMNKTCGIYKVTSPTGQIYIGQSTNIEQRFEHYKRYSSCHKQRRFYDSLHLHGAKAHTFEIVEECAKADLDARERYWQDHFDATGENGLNLRLTAAGELPGKHSEFSKQVMRQKQGGANNPNYGKRGAETSCFGRKRTDAEREAIRSFQATRGRIVQQFDLDGQLISEGRIRDFAAQGHSQGNISSCCTGRLKTHHGYVFKYKEEA
jgi:group I intron endonuclease